MASKMSVKRVDFRTPRSRAEEQLALQIKAVGLPRPVREYQFARPRRFRFDFCWQSHNLAVEVDGGIWTQGRHTRGSGVIGDCEKSFYAALRGWLVVRVTPDHIRSGEAISWVERLIGEMEARHDD